MEDTVSITLRQKASYQFMVDFGPGMPQVLADETPPVGHGEGPTPSHMLLAGVAHCLASSLFFALQKFKKDPGSMTVEASCEVGRNDSNRLRIQKIEVTLRLEKQAAGLAHLERILSQFEDFCTVSQSVRAAIPIKVTVKDGGGGTIHRSG